MVVSNLKGLASTLPEPAAKAADDARPVRGRCRASQWIGAALSPEDVQRFDYELRSLLAQRHPLEPLAIPHRVFAALGTKPG